MAAVGTVTQALELQRQGCERLGSPLYARLLAGLEADHAAGGLTATLLDGRSDRPVHDALPLRLLGVVHRLVLEGRAPDLAAYYPSAGGSRVGDPTAAFLATVRQHPAEVEAGLGRTVQTNEVGRAAALAPAFAHLARTTGRPLRLLELGSSAGLLLRWDGYAYDTGTGTLGDPASPLRFSSVWSVPAPDLSGPVDVDSRQGCDVAPIDATTEDGRLTLLSFVWPDQEERFRRLQAALTVATPWPVTIDAADAGHWLAARLAEPAPGTATVVFHTIVWQYLTTSTRERVKTALADAAERAAVDAPLAWYRMEPAGETADLRLTTWPGGTETVVGTAGYHGVPVVWRSP